MAMVKDMTVGSPLRLLAAFGWPLLLGNMLQYLYSFCDMLLVGRFLGAEALAAVGTVGPLSFMVIGFIFGVTSGISVVTAQRFGAGDLRGVRRSVTTGAWVTAITLILITTLCQLLTTPVLHLMQTPPEVIAGAEAYIRAAFWGNSCFFFFNFQSATLRALGNSRTPLWLLMASSLLNVGFDILFIRGFGWGIASAAWATNLSLFLVAVWCLLFVTRKMPQLQTQRRDWLFRPYFAKKQLYIGIPMGLQFSITGLGAAVLKTAVNGFGPAVMAGLTAAQQFGMLVVELPIAIGQSMSTFAAQNFGAGKITRIRRGVRLAVLCTLLSCAPIALIAFFWGDAFVMLFIPADTPDKAEIIRHGESLLRISTPFFIPLGLIFIFRNVLQGIGASLLPMCAGIGEMVARIGIAWGLIPFMGVAAVYWADPGAWVAACLVLIPAYFFLTYRLRDTLPVISSDTP